MEDSFFSALAFMQADRDPFHGIFVSCKQLSRQSSTMFRNQFLKLSDVAPGLFFKLKTHVIKIEHIKDHIYQENKTHGFQRSAK